MKRQPNLVYVFADQLRLQSCGYAGDEHAETPNIDRLAREACDLRQTVANTPVCAAYRASLLTGKYTSSTGMVINELRLSPEHDCIGHALTRAGYDTSYIGKWHLWANELGHHDETRNAFIPPGPYRMGFDGLWAAYNFNHDSFNAPYFRDTPDRKFWEQYEPDSQTTMAIDYLKSAAHQDRPFALFLSWGPPHDPWTWDNVPEHLRERFARKDIPLSPNYSEEIDPHCDGWQRPDEEYLANLRQYMQGYYAQTTNIDANLGRMMRALDELGLSDDTIFVFTSDHGEMFGSHGRRAKLIFYEEACRVPFLLRWTNTVPAAVRDACFSTVDVMPTLLGLMNIPCPETAEGTDCSQLVLGHGGEEPDAAYMQGIGATAAWVDGSEWRAMRDKQYTYAIYRSDGQELLFDHMADPYQMTNLADDPAHAATMRHYRAKLLDWMNRHNDAFHACSWYESRWTKDRNIVATARGGPPQNLEALQRILREHLPNATTPTSTPTAQ